MSDVADYCRQVEAHLTRVNGGHLVRVVGPGFALVRQWAEDGVPLSVVFKGIEQKAERHRAGASRRPLRIEFCEADVRDVHEAWQRAIGVAAGASVPATEVVDTGSRRRPASRVIDRAVERLGRLAGRLDLSVAFREAVSRAIEQLSAVRESLAVARGAARDPLLAQMAGIERDVLDAARAALDETVRKGLIVQAESELAPYRDRMSAEAWQRAVDVTVDRGVQEHFGIPPLEV